MASLTFRTLQAGDRAEGVSSQPMGAAGQTGKQRGPNYSSLSHLWCLELVKQSVQRTSALLVSPMSQNCSSIS